MRYRLNITGVYIDVDAASEEEAIREGLPEYPEEYRALYVETPYVLEVYPLEATTTKRTIPLMVAELRAELTDPEYVRRTPREVWMRHKERLNRGIQHYNALLEARRADAELEDTQLIDLQDVDLSLPDCGDDGDSFVLVDDETYDAVKKLDEPPTPRKAKVRGVSAGTALFNPDLVE